MWSGAANNEHDDDDVNDNGERVRLYQPMLYGRKPTQSNLASSFIGGQSTTCTAVTSSSESSSNSSNIAKCTTCQDPLKQLVQLYVPKKSSSTNAGNCSSGSATALTMDRTLIVLACNRASCVAGLFSNNSDNNSSSNVLTKTAEGNGVIVCKRYKVVANPENSKQETSSMVTATASAETAPVTMQDNDWTVDDDDMQGDTDMDALEAKLASMESTSATTTTTNKASSSSKTQSNPKVEKSNQGEEARAASGGTSVSFPCFELHSVQEPPARRPVMDEDDVGISASGASNDKIQQMLARYMQEEEDEDILAMLRNQGHGASGNGSNAAIAESDPGVSPEDRALLRFSDRLQRSPRQVLRYAYNGQPVWSVPLPSPNKNKQGSRKQQGKKTRNDCGGEDENAIQVPPCNKCGAPRVFEAQILPSILHVLDVDRFAPAPPPAAAAEAAADADKTANTNYYATAENGGMDFGNIAIYTCSAGCCTGQDEYVVVQDSVDRLQQQQQLPKGRHHHQAQEQRRMYSNNEVVVIPEDSKFDDNDED